MKLIFMGTPAFSATILEGILSDPSYDVLAVVTQPDRAVGRKKTVQMTPVKELALAHQLPVFQPEKLSNSQELQELMTLEADGIVTAAFGQFLPESLLKQFTFAVNVHASLLPKYRGGAPIHYALINGDEQTGVTLMEMVKEMDAGDIIASSAIPIADSDTVGTLFERLAEVGRDLLLDRLPAYARGDIQTVPQDSQQVSFSPNIKPAEEQIDWTRSARDIFNFVRGMNPWPVSYTLWQGERFKIYETSLAEGSGQPGQVLEKGKDYILVATGQGALKLSTVQPAGKPKMSATAFLNGTGRRLEVGDYFG